MNIGDTGKTGANLRALVKSGRVTQEGKGVRGDPYIYRRNNTRLD